MMNITKIPNLYLLLNYIILLPLPILKLFIVNLILNLLRTVVKTIKYK